MAGSFADVDEYVASLPDDVRPVMERIRAGVHAVVPGAGETISYQMPTFTLDGRPLVHLAAWKKHIGLYPLPPMDDGLAADVAPYRATEGTMQVPYTEPFPYELVERVVAALQRARTG